MEEMSVRRPIEAITEEILFYKQQAGTAILEIGRRLLEAKEQLDHGEWLPWLEEKVEFSQSTAQRFMRLAREYTKTSPELNLGAAKALLMLAVPPMEREEFMATPHEVNGEEKTVEEMSRRELEAVIKELEEARGTNEQLRMDLDEQREEMEAERDAAQEARDRAEEYREKAQALRNELEELKASGPVTVTELVIDEEAVKKAAEEARAEAEKKLEKKIAAAEKNREKAEKDLEEARKAQQQEEEKRRGLEGQMEGLRKKLAVAENSAAAEFKLYFNQAQEAINRMNGIIGRMEGDDREGAGRLKNAMKAMMEATLNALA